MLSPTLAGHLWMARDYFASAEKYQYNRPLLEQCGWYSLLCWAEKKYDEEHVTVAQR